MKLAIATVTIMFTAVVFGIFNRRCAVACALFVLHIALGSFIIGCMSHWVSEHQRVAVPGRQYGVGEIHVSA